MVGCRIAGSAQGCGGCTCDPSHPGQGCQWCSCFVYAVLRVNNLLLSPRGNGMQSQQNGTGFGGSSPPLQVVAAALIDAENRVLMQQRPTGKHHAGLWEFPGGKCEGAEAPRVALARELHEELGIIVHADALVPLSFYDGPINAAAGATDPGLVMLLFMCTAWTGDPHPRDGQTMRWVSVAELQTLAMPPADIPLAATLARWQDITRER
jgi:8-oxo-dGTP diphosphatase